MQCLFYYIWKTSLGIGEKLLHVFSVQWFIGCNSRVRETDGVLGVF